MYRLSFYLTPLDVITTGIMPFGNAMSVCGTGANLVVILDFCRAGLWHPFEELKRPQYRERAEILRCFNRMAFVDFLRRSWNVELTWSNYHSSSVYWGI